MSWLNKLLRNKSAESSDPLTAKSENLNDPHAFTNEDKLNLRTDYKKVFPRLKMGQLENATDVSANILQTDGIEKNMQIPEEGQLFGIDIGSDFTCCFAEDSGDLYMLLTKGKAMEKTREEIYTLACTNFIDEFGEKVEVHSTNWQDVYMVRIDGNSEATTFLMPQFWDQICQSLVTKELNLLMPLQDIVVFWKEITDDVYQEVIMNLQKLIREQKESRRVSNYQFLWKENQFYETGKVFE